MHSLRAAFLAFVFLLLTPFAEARTLRSYAEIEAEFRARGFSGTALVARDSELLYEAAFGAKDMRTQEPNTTGTRFAIGSITKQFAAAGILQLRDEGRLSLDDRLSKHLDGFAFGDQVTLKQLLTHTAGVSNYTDRTEFWELVNSGQLLSLTGIFDLFRNLPLDFEPGSDWYYSNSGYVLLGGIIEKISGTSFGKFLRERFFDPFGMRDSAYDPTESLEGHAQPHDLDRDYEPARGPFRSLSWAHAAGGMTSTTRDLWRWNRALDALEVLPAATLEEMQTPVRNDYGYALMINEAFGRKAVWHTGGLPGYVAYDIRVPSEKLHVIVLSNQFDPGKRNDFTHALLELALTGKAEVDEIAAPTPVPAETLASYAGRYVNEELGLRISVTFESGRLYLRVDGQSQFWLIPRSETEFEIRDIARVRFEIRDGAVEMVVLQGGQEFRLKTMPATH